MKKLIFILFLLPITSFGQTFSASYSPSGWGFSYDVTAQVSLTKSDQLGKHYTVTLKSATVQSKGWKEVDGKYYSCSQLGNLCNNHFPGWMLICLKFNYQGLRTSCTDNYSRVGEQIEVVIPWKDASNITGIELQGVNEDPSFLPLVNNRIKELNKTSTYSSTSAVNAAGNTNSVSNNTSPSKTTSSSGTGSTTQKTTTTPAYDPNTGLMNNPLPYSAPASNNKLVQDVQVTTAAASALVDLFTPSAEEQERRRIKREEQDKQFELAKAEKDRKEKEIKNKRYLEKYHNVFYEKAKNGDDEAKMILYHASYSLWSTGLLPERKAWFQDALAHKNHDAMMEEAYNIGGLTMNFNNLIYLADRGCVDAMVCLGDYFNRKKDNDYGGGESQSSALYWYKKAADLGSPSANFYLGVIYHFGYNLRIYGFNGMNFEKKGFVKYDVEKDEKIAFDYFTKALQPNFVPSIYSFDTNYGSRFSPTVYYMLSVYYKKGLGGVEKDKKLAEEYFQKYKDYDRPDW